MIYRHLVALARADFEAAQTHVRPLSDGLCFAAHRWLNPESACRIGPREAAWRAPIQFPRFTSRQRVHRPNTGRPRPSYKFEVVRGFVQGL